MSDEPAIGIDLGTTYSCVGVFRFGKVEIIANDQGYKITPSYVAFTKDETFVGEPAKEQSARNYENTIFDAKRLIGRKFEDLTVQADIKLWPFKVIKDDINSLPKIKIEYAGKVETYFPEQISAMVLGKMKEFAEAYLGKPVRKAVITVPAYFNDSQRQATIDAATIAGLEVLRIINEPTAAAMAYGLQENISEERNVLIFDLGGGTFDVSILCIQNDVFEVKSTAGDTHLGGEDFDNRMVDHFMKEFQRQHRKYIGHNKKALRRLKEACERAKRTLSSAVTAAIDICSLHDNIDFYCTITRAKFESLNGDLFQNTMVQVEKALRDAEMNKTDIDDIVLVGGSSRIPKVQKLLQDFFPGKDLKKSVNFDEAVAYGAALQAAILNGDKSKEVRDLVLMDVTPLSLGTETQMWCENEQRLKEGLMCVVIKRNTLIPCRITKEDYSTVYDYQTRVGFPVYEGEYVVAKQNNFLGKFTLENVPSAPQGVLKIDVTFDINVNGILNVTAVERSTGVQNQITISYNKGRLSEDEIKKMIKDAERNKIKEVERKSVLDARNSLEAYCVDMMNTIEETSLKNEINKSDKELILKKCNETIAWLNTDLQIEKITFEQKQKEIRDFFDLIIMMATNPETRKEKFYEMLNVSRGASKKEIESGFRDFARINHPDKFKGDKDIGEWMWLKVTEAKNVLINMWKEQST